MKNSVVKPYLEFAYIGPLNCGDDNQIEKIQLGSTPSGSLQSLDAIPANLKTEIHETPSAIFRSFLPTDFAVGHAPDCSSQRVFLFRPEDNYPEESATKIS